MVQAHREGRRVGQTGVFYAYVVNAFSLSERKSHRREWSSGSALVQSLQKNSVNSDGVPLLAMIGDQGTHVAEVDCDSYKGGTFEPEATPHGFSFVISPEPFSIFSIITSSSSP